jgi:hypothetical protein
MEWWKARLFIRGKAREEFRALDKLGVKLQGKIMVVTSFAPGWRFT